MSFPTPSVHWAQLGEVSASPFLASESAGDTVMRINRKHGVVLIDRSDFLRLPGWIEVEKCQSGSPRARLVWREGGRRHRVWLARHILGVERNAVVDHKNHNTLDNRRSNLRIATSRQNSYNKAKSNGKSSLFKGVCRRRSKWRARIFVDNKQISLGDFVDEVSAARAYDAAARRIFGEFAAVNFPSAGEQSAHGHIPANPINVAIFPVHHGE